jgi:hypothetical protein
MVCVEELAGLNGAINGKGRAHASKFVAIVIAVVPRGFFLGCRHRNAPRQLAPNH